MRSILLHAKRFIKIEHELQRMTGKLSKAAKAARFRWMAAPLGKVLKGCF
jgi:hypothetical protein